jgi:hypothetical protein
MPPARTWGSITIEILIAFAVLTLTLSAVFVLICGNDAEKLDREIDELSLAKSALTDSLAPDTEYWNIVSTTTTAILNDTDYLIETKVRDETSCLKSVLVRASLHNPTSFEEVSDGVELSTYIANDVEAEALGGDCDAKPSHSSWQYPKPFASQSISDVSGTALDVLGGIAYIGLSAPPYFAIADTRTAMPGQMQGLILAFDNNFSLYAQPNALDAIIKTDATGSTHRYVFAALQATSSQLAVIDVTDSSNPFLIATSTLYGVNSNGANPQARHIFYYDGGVYVTTGRITGIQPELHIFDVHDPSHPFEIGTANLETVVNDLAVRGDYLYVAAGQYAKELAVYDVSNPASVSATPIATVDLSSTQDGTSLALSGNSLYFGRASATSSPELYAFDISHLMKAIPILGSGEVGSKDVSGIKISGDTVFITATLDTASTRRFEGWNIASSTNPVRLFQFPDAGLTPHGIDYENGRLYATGSTTLQIFESI